MLRTQGFGFKGNRDVGRVLIIDDLVDTGKPPRLFDECPKAHFAAVYAKPDGRAFVIYITEVSQDT